MSRIWFWLIVVLLAVALGAGWASAYLRETVPL